LVKLWQFQPEDRTVVRLNINELTSLPYPEESSTSVIPLFKDNHEEVSVVDMPPFSALEFTPKGGAELFVLQGSVYEQQDESTKMLDEVSTVKIVALIGFAYSDSLVDTCTKLVEELHAQNNSIRGLLLRVSNLITAIAMKDLST
jgi:hypothetical protein